jgi:prepilin-type processing-associated H-X9-DG protein
MSQDMLPEQFVCPATEDEVDDVGSRTNATRMNFATPYHLSYSFVNVYPTMDALGKGYKTFITAFASDFAIASDINPGGLELTKLTPDSPPLKLRLGNSPNHGGDGQNVLYADGHAEYVRTPFAGGAGRQGNNVRDNIFTYGEATATSGGVGITGSPVDSQDSVLLPTAAERGKRPPTSRPARVVLAERMATTRPMRPNDLQTLQARKYVAPNGDFVLFVSPMEADVQLGQQLSAARYTTGVNGKLRMVLTIKGDTVVQYYQVNVGEAYGQISEITDEKGTIFKFSR